MWLLISIIAYLLNSVSTVIDKFLLTNKNPHPAVYTFFISVLSALAIILAPFGFVWPSWLQFFLSLMAGAIFTFALLFMFKALLKNEATRITPFMGGLQPIIIFVLAWLFLAEKLNFFAGFGFLVIILGTVVLSWQENTPNHFGQSAKKSYVLAIVSTILFAISYTVSKYVYLEQNFISGFVLTRVGALLAAFSLFLMPLNRRLIIKEIRKPKKDFSVLFLIGQTAGALSFILVNYAIAISESVAVVNALRGMEYVFLLIIAIILSRKFPSLLREKFTPKIIAQKVVAIGLIVAGLIFFVS